MKECKYLECILCEGKDMAESVEIFNKEMKRQARLRPTYERDGNRFLIYIKNIERVPESLAEEKELEGCDHRCIECSHCERRRNEDGQYDLRTVWGFCTKKGHKTKLSGSVCDVFYKEGQDGAGFRPRLITNDLSDMLMKEVTAL